FDSAQTKNALSHRPAVAARWRAFSTGARNVRSWHFASFRCVAKFVGYWTNNGQRLALGPDGSAAIDPKQTSRTRWRRLIDLRYGFELATEGPEIRSDFTPLALQKRACRRGARNHEIGTETIELAITATGISFIASACSGVAKTRMAPTPKVTACTI